VLKGSWTVQRANAGTPVLSRDVALATPAGASDAAEEAAGMSRLLGELASEIAAGLPQAL